MPERPQRIEAGEGLRRICIRRPLEAEGFKTADDLAAVSSLGAPFGRGFHLARPRPAADPCAVEAAS